MQWILLLLGALFGLVVVLLIVGMLLPRAHRATSVLNLPKTTPAEVWAVIRDLGRVPEFWPDVRTSERKPDRDGKEVWVQTMKNGFALPLVIEEDSPPTRLVTRIAIEGKAPFGGTWIYEITGSGTGSKVTVTEDGFIGNPLFRVVSRIMGYHSTLDSYLTALARRMGENARPVHQS
jgi:hypothetical protein